MKLLVDMNLSPAWVAVFNGAGTEAVHWSDVGPGNAPDEQIFRHARDEGWTIFTHDLDFSAILFHSQARAPSVIQLRSEDTRPATMRAVVLNAIQSTTAELEQGAVLSIDPRRGRLHLLPLGHSTDDN